MSVKDTLGRLLESRRKERDQTLFYRALATRAEGDGDSEAAERLFNLLADEQHHLSRLSARVLELGGHTDEAGPQEAQEGDLAGWEERARARELQEVAWYESLLQAETDETTRAVFQEILESERHHAEKLAGKWMSA
jgi:rubrerythrin